MGKTIFAAILAAVLTSIATSLVLASLATDARTASDDLRRKAEATAQVERERLERRVAELEKRTPRAPRAERGTDTPTESASVVTTEAVPPPPLSPDGTPYVSKADLDRALAAHVPVVPEGDVPQPSARKTLEEIAKDMNLSAGEEANLREILRESEEEMVTNLFGDRPYDDVKRELIAAREDPDKQAALMQGVVQHGIANMGKLLTLKNRTQKKVEAVLGADRAAKFFSTPHKPLIDPEFEEILKGKL